MATTSETYLKQLEGYNNPNAPEQINQLVKKAYEGPIGVLINEGNAAREQYYPEFFNAAQRYGTEASDMSPAARLASMIGDSERLGGRYRQNLGIRDYYGTMTNDLVNRAMQGYQMGYGNLRDLYMMQYQREQDAAAAARAGRGGAGGNPYQSILDQLSERMNGKIGGGIFGAGPGRGGTLRRQPGYMGGQRAAVPLASQFAQKAPGFNY